MRPQTTRIHANLERHSNSTARRHYGPAKNVDVRVNYLPALTEVSPMVYLDQLTPYIALQRLHDIVDRYARARRLLDALVLVEAERGSDDEAVSSPPLAMATALETIEDCRQAVAPAIALAEGAITRKQMALHSIMTDQHAPAARRGLLRWIESQRGPHAPPVDAILDGLADEVGHELELARD